MKACDVVKRLTRAFPETATWERLRGEPYGPAHVELDATVRRVLYCVTVNPDVEDYWKAGRYDFLVSHHPFRPRSPIPNLVLHTALDCAPGGLNDLWRDALDLEDARPITGNLGWVGRVPLMSFEDIVAKVRAYAGEIEGQILEPGATVLAVAVCSGLGGFVAEEAAATGADVYVTGELIQPASSLGIPGVIEIGHTRSERVGVHAIQTVLGPDVAVDVVPLEIDRWSGEVFGGRRAA